ncbi:TonB-dependent receptor [Luteimonas terrae]|uniref:Outer membrane receptor protein involved in Fe transport n=1 Tax=Luteimonas terrae TaxID=1530191 RepID=A0ABU1XYS9_9GAMM|nr:TonB-dependent receptor [Luteimonas terrae]MDR7193951.1 outer membrane receptor protein involved in Fe transport [Luteimonas terrae]
MHAFRSARPWFRSPLSLAIASTLACAATAPLLAQDSTDTSSSPRATNAVTLDSVVVTANKRVENVRDVGASISVIGERQLENMGASSLSDYAALIPGMQVQNGGSPGLSTVSLRGISALSSGATVATYIDEVPVGSSGIYQGASGLMLDLLPYDISRVEVLRGPQGTLYGAGAIGGLLKYVTRAPDLTHAEARVGFGVRSVSDGGEGWNGRFGISLPLQEDRLGLRMSFARNGLPGYTDNAIDGRRDINEGEQVGGRMALSWDGDVADIDLSVLHQRINADDRAQVALDPGSYAPLGGEFEGRTWQPQPFTKELTLASLSVVWDLGWGDFVSATGWSETRTLDQIDSTVQFGEVADLLLGFPEPGSSNVRYTFDLDKITQEFRFTSRTGGRFEWMAGAFYTKEDAQQNQVAWLGQRDGSPLPAPFDTAFGTLAVIGLPSTYEEVAVFANASWRFGERFKIDAGLRQARNDQWFSQNVSEGILAPIGDAPGESTEDVFTWSLSPQFKLAEDKMLYARFATGYQPGGPNVALPGIPPSVDSSMLASYEVGLKSQSADRRFQADVSAFRIEWDDIQVASSFNGIGGLVNGGEATSEGVELASQFRATEALTLGVNAAYTSARVENDFEPTTIPQGDFDVVLNTGLAGDRMPYVPTLSWAATAEYAFMTAQGLSGQVGGVLRFTGDRLNDTTERQRITAPGDPSTVLQEDVTAPLRLDSYRALDLYAGVGRERWELRAYVSNVTGEGGFSSMTPAAGALSGTVAYLAAVPIQPRTFGVEFDVRF